VKAPAKKTTKTAKPTGTGAKGRASAAPAKPAAKAAVKTKAKAPAKAPAKSAKTPAKVTKPAAAAKKAVPAKSKPAAKAPAKAAARPAAKPAAKPMAKPAAKAAAKVAKPAAAPAKPARAAASKPVAKSATPVFGKPVTVPPPKKPITLPVVQPTPRPLGKRAAKKVMMEQMTQAEVVPTHAPDAAKATFSTMNERVVMTPPVPSAIRKDPKRANNWKSLPVDQLTDEDIQAMPDNEYMGDLQLAYFRRKLSQLRADMLANAGETTEHLREDTVVVPDPADRATIEEEHALELRTRDRERKLLKKIEQAIARIDSGDYGYCEETGEPIGVGRLMARPTASLSLEAQQRRELKQKMFGD
jgi:DnaK suppressor protein